MENPNPGSSFTNFVLALLVLMAPATSFAQWNANDSVPVSTDGSEIELVMIGDGAGGSFMAWSKWIPEIGWRILAQHSDADGYLLWQAGGLQVSSGQGYQPQLVLDGSGGVLVVWRQWGVRAMRLDASGSAVWSSEVEVVSNDDYPTYAPACTGDGSGGVIVVWDGPDHFTSDRELFDIRAQRVSGSGELFWGSAPVLVCGAPGYQSGARAIADGQGGAIFSWRHEGATADADIFAQRVDATGQLLWNSGGQSVCEATGVQEAVAVHGDGAGGAIAVWQDGRASTGAVYGQRLNALGQARWTADGVLVGGVSSPDIEFRSTGDLAGGVIVAWVGDSSVTGPRTAQRIDGSGTLLWPAGGVVIADEDQAPRAPQVVADGSGGAFFAWADGRRVDCLDTYAQHLDGVGGLLWEASGVVVAAIEQTRIPHGIAALDGTEALVFWGSPGPATGLPRDPAERSGLPLRRAGTSPTAVVLSRVAAAGTGWTADCEPPVAAPSPPASIAVSSRPNPFNPRTTITYVLPVDGHVRLVVYDAAGRVVRNLMNRWESAGRHELGWDGRDERGRRAPSGVYFSRITVGEYEALSRMLLLK
jgi:hypothetical protein